MSSHSDSSGVEAESDPDHDNCEIPHQCLRESEEKARSDTVEETRDQSTDRANNALPLPSTGEEDGENDSIGSWEQVSQDGDEPSKPDPPRVLPLGLSRRSGFSSFDDYE